MINSVVLVGRIANDPEMKYTPSGLPITNFRIGVSRNRKSESGEDLTDWFSIVCFQKTAEFVAQYLDKGSLIGIEGRLQSRSWEDPSGKRVSFIEVVANTVQALESRAEAERRRAQRGQSGPGGQAPQGVAGGYNAGAQGGYNAGAQGGYGGGSAPAAAPAQPPPPDDYAPLGANDDPFGDQ